MSVVYDLAGLIDSGCRGPELAEALRGASRLDVYQALGICARLRDADDLIQSGEPRLQIGTSPWAAFFATPHGKVEKARILALPRNRSKTRSRLG